LVLVELTNKGYYLIAVFLIIISSISVYYYIRIIKIIFFEPNATKLLHEEVFQVLFLDGYLKNLYFIFAFLLFCLITIFFYPGNLILFCNYIIFKTIL
jgi:NADH:ubiquinone oxidoreductase subunit 2 (subunit N)